jgi:hypothetical protein
MKWTWIHMIIIWLDYDVDPTYSKHPPNSIAKQTTANQVGVTAYYFLNGLNLPFIFGDTCQIQLSLSNGQDCFVACILPDRIWINWEQMDFDIDDNTSRFKPQINPPLYESIPNKLLLVHLNLKETLVLGLWKPRCQERAPQLSIENRGVYNLGW